MSSTLQRRSGVLSDVGPPEHAAQCFLAARLRGILEQGKLPLISTDMDDTFLPFGNVIGDRELDLLVAYVDAGGQLAFNTLAPKEWFYVRVIDRMVSTFHQRNCVSLLRRVHWIVSGGRELFVFDSPNHSYRRIRAASTGSKAEGLLYLLRHLDNNVALLALYGDRFDDPGNDGNALGVQDIPLVINVGADQQVPECNTRQVFVNAVKKGPATTLCHLAFVTAKLRELSPPVFPVEESVPSGERTQARQPWQFEASTPRQKPCAVQVHGPGFLWSWNDRGLSYLTALARNISKAVYTARLPDGVAGFTFFWTGGPDSTTGQAAGHWEGRDFRL